MTEKNKDKGLDATIQDIEVFIKKTKNSYLTTLQIQDQRWLAGASHCTVRRLMREGKLPSIKVGATLKTHYLDLIEFIKQIYQNKSI